MLRKDWQNWSPLQITVVACALVYAIVYIAMLCLHPGSEQFYQNFQNVYQIIPPFFAGVCCFSCAWYKEHTLKNYRAAWFCLGLGAALWGAGQATWTHYESYLHQNPFPMADIGYLGGYPFLVAGLILLFGSMPIAGRARLLFDGLIASSGAGVLSWYFLISPSLNKHGSLLERLLGSAYPVADTGLLFGAVVLLYSRTTTKVLRYSSLFLAVGLVLFSLADWLFYYEGESYSTGSWFDWGWSFGWVLLGFSALVPLWWPYSLPEEATSNASPAVAHGLEVGLPLQRANFWENISPLALLKVVVPYIISLTAFGVIAYHDYHSPKTALSPEGLLEFQRRYAPIGAAWPDDVMVHLHKFIQEKHGVGLIHFSTLAAGAWLILLTIARQVITLVENHNLNAQLRTFNANLERTITQRTQQLSSLYELTKSVNNTLHADQMLSNAMEFAQRALQADAVVLHLSSPLNIVGFPTFMHHGLSDRSDMLHLFKALPPPTSVEIMPLARKATEAGSEAELLPSTHALGNQAAGGFYLRAPLAWRDGSVGTLGVVRWDGDFGTTEAEMLESIGIEVAAAYKNAELYAQAVETADRDSVTGLYNHRAIQSRLQREFDRAEEQNRPLTVIMMDLNNFKMFNDTYGHPVGDQILKRVANVLQTGCRKPDILGRYGGDEFIAILPDTDLPLAMVVAQRWRDRMSMEGFSEADEDRTIPVSLSFGIATYPTDSTNRYDLLSTADANLYSAKVSDKGIVTTTETQRQHRQLRAESSFDVLDAMITAVDNKDHYTRRHSEDVTTYALWIAEELGLSEETMRIVRLSGLLHDVGKIGVPETILRKPGRLTNEEFEIMKQHPQFGAFIVGGVPGMHEILDGVRHHHERWDGKGYPDGLAGEAVPFMGRLLAVADAFSAMTTARPYRKGLAWDDAMQEISNNLNTQFDPTMAAAFLRAATKRRPSSKPSSPVLQLVREPATVTVPAPTTPRSNMPTLVASGE